MVAVAASDARITGERNMNRTPDSRWPRSRRAGSGSASRIKPSVSADTRNENASTISATGPEKAWTSNPAAAGPPTNENARLPFRSDCPSTYLSRGTIA